MRRGTTKLFAEAVTGVQKTELCWPVYNYSLVYIIVYCTDTLLYFTVADSQKTSAAVAVAVAVALVHWLCGSNNPMRVEKRVNMGTLSAIHQLSFVIRQSQMSPERTIKPQLSTKQTGGAATYQKRTFVCSTSAFS